MKLSFIFLVLTVKAVSGQSCPECKCDKKELCKAITTNPNVEVFGFAPDYVKDYHRYDWDLLTTVAWRTDPEFVCYAHQHGVRVVYLAEGYNTDNLNNQTWRQQWIDEQVQYALDNYLDGVNFDAEGESFSNDLFTQLYTQLVKETAEAFHTKIPGSQISIDIPWSPYGVDNRYYDWVGLADAADVLFVMAYDMQSQIWGRCVASANSPVALVNKGLQQFIVELGISPKKLVLGLPWYGYMYPCYDSNGKRSYEINEVCQLREVSFRGSPCSDAAGFQKPFYTLYDDFLHNNSNINLQWDNIQKSPYFNVQNQRGEVDQIWYDNIESLKTKYDLVNKWNLKGVGFWNIDLLDYNKENKEAFKVTQQMWEAVKMALFPTNSEQN